MFFKKTTSKRTLLGVSPPITKIKGLFLAIVASSTMTLSASASADDFIGVAAAMHGDVIRISTSGSNAGIGQVTSGTKIYLGDEIEVAANSRMQILLRDETVFTLGSGARLTIDEFVFDPAEQTGSLTTQITKGAFRFVSGKLAKSSPTAMKVRLPSAMLSIRGTQVASLVDEDGGGQVVLVGPGPNNFGASLGAVTVTNPFGSVDLTRPNFSTFIDTGTPPATPAPASAALIDQIEQSTGETAETQIAEALGEGSLETVPATDTDSDGIPDLIAANSQLGASITNATSGTAVTNDDAILSAVFSALSTAMSDGQPDEDDIGMLGVNLGSGAAVLFGGSAEFNGDMTIDELLNAGLSGSAVYAAEDVAITCLNSSAAGCGGSYDVTDTWNFDSGTMTQAVSNGSFAIDHNGNGTLDANIGFALTATIDYSAGGPLGGNITATDPEGAILAYMHVATEIDTSLSTVAYGFSQTEAHIGVDHAVNGFDWTAQAGNSVTVTDQGGSNLPGNIVIGSDAYLSNFTLGGDSSSTNAIGNVASHELSIFDNAGNELATGSVHGMAQQ
ncbi:MAG: FecR domain-containing protein [Alphaproteobacteria bacterium]|nr:FecR domain-containing protein [Alphaproteobacteria bacterium]